MEKNYEPASYTYIYNDLNKQNKLKSFILKPKKQTKMKKAIYVVLVAVSMTLAFSTTASAQKKIEVKVESKAVETNRGANPNIKSGAPTTDNAESKARGTCRVYFDNYTGLYVNIYVDGYYKGQLSPYGEGSVSVSSGYTTVYCLSAGGTREWSAAGGCTGSYYFKLN